MTPNGIIRLKLDETIGGKPNLTLYNDASGRDIRPTDLSPNGYATIGFGRNLMGNGISVIEADYLFSNDVAECEAIIIAQNIWLSNYISTVDSATAVRGDVVTMVEFNTGHVAGFPKMLAAVKAQNWTVAAAELIDSDAARELPTRYGRLHTAMLVGSWLNLLS